MKKRDLPVRNIDFNISNTEPQSCFMHNSSMITQNGIKSGKRKRYRLRKKSLKRLAAVILAVCIFVIDANLFDARLAHNIGNGAKKVATYVLENYIGERAQNQNTLYTRLSYDKPADFDIVHESDLADSEFPDTVHMPQTESAVTVSGGTSQSFVDGTRFYPITSLDLSAESIYSLSNGTSFSPDMQRLGEITPKALRDIDRQDGPLVLIVHTHAEECYTEFSDSYPEGDNTRSSDTEKNVVRVGEEIADTLSRFGIETLHCRKMHDSESFINAYSGSAESVKKYLEEYPSVKIVVDVHRDAIIREDGESVRAVTDIAGQSYAQLMFVVGTNELGHNHPDWQDNLSLALSLQKSINDTYPSLCRSINLRNVPFNQQLSSGYLLLEVGTCANTLDEALRSARAFGENLARALVTSRN